MRKPWSVNWVRRGDFVDVFVLTMTACVWIIYVLVAAVFYVAAGAFLLARWLIRRRRAKHQEKQPVSTATAPSGLPTARLAGTTVRFLDQEAEVIYRPERVTEEMWCQLERGVTDMDEKLAAQYVSRLVAEWDVLKRGRPYPIEQDAIRELPAVFVKAVFAQIMIDTGQRQASAVRTVSGPTG